ncbi:MAG TPA: WhiB family transcriptional regulator [Streptosporangiaceae bacterium]|jgi:WhiB family redox-sensing transcriptional regulator
MNSHWQTDDWRSGAACLSADPDLFFPISATPASASQVSCARAYCARCEVRSDCARFALEHPEVQGIWGGLTDAERKSLLRGRRDRAARAGRAA